MSEGIYARDLYDLRQEAWAEFEDEINDELTEALSDEISDIAREAQEEFTVDIKSFITNGITN